MVIKSKLRLALAAEKGVDFKKLKQQKKHKAALKRKHASGTISPEVETVYASDENIDIGSDKDEVPEIPNLEAIDESDTSDSEIELEKRQPQNSCRKSHKDVQKGGIGEVKENDDHGDEDKNEVKEAEEGEEEEEEEEEEDEEDIPISDLEDLDEDHREDLVAHTRLIINNTSALLAALDRFSIPTDNRVPFATHQSVVSSMETSESIPDVSDDLQRELAFYSQCLGASRQGRCNLLSEGVPFSRPKDYFAEMVKEDAHMEKVKAKMVEEASAKKAAVEARKLRDLKKFGKQVQIAKLQERQKAKRETLEKIKTLKRKRQESSGDLGTNEADLFDVGVDNEIAKYSQRSGSDRAKIGSGPATNIKRQKKNEKYGFGGKKRHAKSGDAISSGDLSSFNARKMKAGGKSKGKVSRPGKSKRKAMAMK